MPYNRWTYIYHFRLEIKGSHSGLAHIGTQSKRNSCMGPEDFTLLYSNFAISIQRNVVKKSLDITNFVIMLSNVRTSSYCHTMSKNSNNSCIFIRASLLLLVLGWLISQWEHTANSVEPFGVRTGEIGGFYKKGTHKCSGLICFSFLDS